MLLFSQLVSLRSFGPAFAVATRLVRPTSRANKHAYLLGVAGLSSVIQTFEILFRSDS